MYFKQRPFCEEVFDVGATDRIEAVKPLLTAARQVEHALHVESEP